MKQITDIISETSFGESRVGFFSGDQLIECWIEKNQSFAKITEIHLAKVMQIVKPINRIFYKLYNGTEVSSRCFENFPETGTLEIITIASDTKITTLDSKALPPSRKRRRGVTSLQEKRKHRGQCLVVLGALPSTFQLHPSNTL